MRPLPQTQKGQWLRGIPIGCVLLTLVLVIQSVPDDNLPQGYFLLLIPSALLFTLMYMTQKEKKSVIKEIAAGLWIAAIACFCVELIAHIPTIIVDMCCRKATTLPGF